MGIPGRLKSIAPRVISRYSTVSFGGNADRLGLALIQIAAYVQANSGRPLEAQVGSQLARIVGEKLDRDDRAAKSKFSGGRPATADFRSQLEAI